MTSKQDQLVVAPYNPGDHWLLVVINPYDDVVYHLDSLRTSCQDDIKYCPLQVGTVECGYYVMRYMRKIIDTRNSYSQLELDEIRVEWTEFLARVKYAILTVDSDVNTVSIDYLTLLKVSSKGLLDTVLTSSNPFSVVVINDAWYVLSTSSLAYK
uniref:Ubiquitin-like protease family profile domain-containing protein n=1 Tax=Cucumis melo TaxID=3656 RepID=A0A9I9EB73_CUCME